MTPQSRRKATNVGIGALALVAVIGWVVPKSADAVTEAVDARYVRADTFRVFQQGLRVREITDSASLAGEFKEVRRMVAGLDSSDRCRRGQRGYCR